MRFSSTVKFWLYGFAGYFGGLLLSAVLWSLPEGVGDYGEADSFILTTDLSPVSLVWTLGFVGGFVLAMFAASEMIARLIFPDRWKTEKTKIATKGARWSRRVRAERRYKGWVMISKRELGEIYIAALLGLLHVCIFIFYLYV